MPKNKSHFHQSINPHARIAPVKLDLKLNIAIDDSLRKKLDLLKTSFFSAHSTQKTNASNINLDSHFKYPTSIAKFSQEKFVEEYKKKHPENKAFFEAKGSKPLAAGLCGGLVFTWYKILNENANLLDVLANDPKDFLIKKIIQRQRLLGYSPVARNTSAKDNSDEKRAVIADMDVSEPHQAFGHFGFDKMTELSIPKNHEDEIAKHINRLEEKNYHTIGLHLISAFPETGAGHVCGWTSCENGYLLFDPNKGEYFFDSFDKFKNYLNHHLLNMFSGDTNLSITLMDCYYEHELETVKNLSPKVSKT